jgi:hypothetical protein
MAQQQLEWHTLTRQDVELYTKFFVLCKRDGITEFTSDTFRNYNLHAQLSDLQHGIGTLFAKWKWHRLIEEESGRVRSQVESNHKRRISVFKFKEAKI